MANNDKQLYLSWLNDAHAMEQQIVHVLQGQLDDAKDMPMVENKLREHLDATKRHADLIKGCIDRNGGSTSSVKSGMASMMGAVQGMSTGSAQDKLVKDALEDFGTENFEIASYNSLIVAAREMGDNETVNVCQSILRDEQDMSNFLMNNIPMLTSNALGKTAGGQRQAGAS